MSAAAARWRRFASPSLFAQMPLRILALLMAVMPTAHADIYRCPGKARMTVYQNFPCEFDRLSSMPAAGVSGASVSRVSAAGSRTGASSAATMPRVGMTAAQVKAIWGEPMTTTKEEYAKGDIETWSYADSRSVRFDLKGRVAKVNR
jgi:hypothetical protein